MPDLNEVLLTIAGRSEGAQQAIERVRSELKSVPDTTTANFNLAIGEAQAELEAIKGELKGIDRSKYSAEVQLAIGKALAQVEAFKARLDSIPRKKTVSLEMRNSILTTLANTEKGIVSLGRGLRETEDRAASLGTAFSRATGPLRALGPLVTGISVALTTVLVPAIVAVGSSALGAVAGVGALAAALASSLGPAAVIAAAAFSRFQKILDARKAAQSAADAQSKAGAKSEAGVADAVEERRQREGELAAALRARGSAERSLSDARKAAAKDIAAANRAVVDAQSQVKQSAVDVSRATADAYRDISDSIEGVRDAMLDLQDAQLGIERSKLNLDQAQAELEDFRRSAGLAGASFDQLFKKISDVGFDDSKLKGMLSGGGALGGVGNDDQLKLRGIILQIKEAKLGEKQATDRLKHSEVDLGDARKKQATYAQQGIAAYKPLTDAQDRQKDSLLQLTEAQQKSNDLSKAGIGNATSVLSATEALAGAQERLRRARADKAKPLASAAAAATAAEEAKAKLDALTASERRFYDAIKNTGGLLKGVFQPAVDQVFDGLSGALERIGPRVGGLKGVFTNLGTAMKDSITGFIDTISSPAAFKNLSDIIASSGDFIRQIGPLLGGFANAIGAIGGKNIGALTDLAKSLGDSLKSFTDNVAKGGLDKFFGQSQDSLKAFVDLFGGLLDLGRSMVEVIGPFGDDLVKFLADGARNLAKMMRGGKGAKRFQDFFKNVLPALKEIGVFLIKVIAFGALLFEAFAPFITGFFKGLNSILDVLNLFVGALAKVTNFGPIKAILKIVGYITALVVSGQGISKLLGYLGKVPLLMSRLFGSIGRFGNIIKGLGGRIFAALGNGLKAGARAIYGLGRGVITRLINGIKSGFTSVGRIGRSVVTRLINGVKAIGGAAGRAGEWLIRRVIRGIRNIATGIYNLGRNIVTGFIRGAKSLGGKLLKDVGGIFTAIIDKAKQLLGIKSPSKVFYTYGQQTIQGFVNGLLAGRSNVWTALEKVMDFERLLSPMGLGKAIGGKIAHFGLSAAKGLPGLFADAFGRGKEAVRSAVDFFGGLATGGLVTGPTAKVLGERGREVVLPLSQKVMANLAKSIVAQMNAGMSPAISGMGGVKMEQHFHIPPSPAGKQPDAEHTAALLARTMRRRGGR